MASMNTASAQIQHVFPPVQGNWASKLYVFGLFVFVMASHFSISASQIGLGLALIGCFFMYRQGSIGIEKTAVAAPFAFMTLTGLLSAFRANETYKALFEMNLYLILIVFFLPYWPKMQKKFQQKLIYTFIFSAAFVSLVNCLQILVGMVDAKHARGFFSVCITFGECMSLAGVTTLLALATNRFSRRFNFLLLVALALISSSMVFALNRGAWLGFIVGSLVLTIRFPRRMIPLIAIFFLLVGAAALQNADFRERLSGFSLSKTMSAANKSVDESYDTIALYSNLQRLYIWTRGFIMLEDNLPFGVGLRNVKTHYKRLASTYESENGMIYGHQHSNFMQTFAMNGFVGLTAFFYVLIAFAKFTLNELSASADDDNPEWPKGAIAILATFVVFGLTEYAWGDQEVAMMAFFLMGLLTNQSASQARDSSIDLLPATIE